MGRRRGINPWIPNQHGAWPMVTIPPLLGLILGFCGPGERTAISLLATLLVLLSWMSGYFCFFAGGLLFKARRRQHRGTFLAPTLTYGGVAALCAVVALLLRPSLLWWAILFVPLVGIAVEEILMNRPRSTFSGCATTCASGAVLAVMDTVGRGDGGPAGTSTVGIISAIVMALYFSGTVPYVKSMIRKKGNRRYLIGSVTYQVVAALVVAVLALKWVPILAAIIMVAVMVWSIGRAILVPYSAQKGTVWTPKRVGRAEVPATIVMAIAVILAGVLAA
ncbi:YwiC-like family protein [Corynebacterium uropygiale]|uniref:YwiC-like family protein n=1 Tax=Corynebacterium uropygiale TaxID=1775911 RepID=A0A9X1QR29_9CORY|nr:YwiC-like family protein [Corynebacterium uropygiale]MCF4006208.1 YwiC-like family protein [Corynebacterium uropygiale]